MINLKVFTQIERFEDFINNQNFIIKDIQVKPTENTYATQEMFIATVLYEIKETNNAT